MDIYPIVMATITIVCSLYGMFLIASRIIERKIKTQVDERLNGLEEHIKEIDLSLKSK